MEYSSSFESPEELVESKHQCRKNLRRGMSINQDQFCRINFYMFCLFSHMSCVKAVPRFIVLIVFGLLLVAVLVFQVALLLKRGCTMSNIILVMPVIITSVTCISLLLLIYANKSRIESLVSITASAYRKRQKNVAHVKIMKSVQTIKLVVRMISIAMPIGVTGFFFLALIPLVLDIISPLNETRPLQLVFEGEHFVDEQEYFYLLLSFQYAASGAIVAIVGVIMNICIIIVTSICAWFTLIGIELESVSSLAGIPEESHGLLKRKIIFCIREHLTALKYSYLCNICTEWLLFAGLIGTSSAFPLLLVQLSDPELVDVKCVLYTMVEIGQFCILNFLGQRVINCSSRVSEDAYNVRWYELPVNIQKLFLLLIMRSQHPCRFGVKNIYTLSMSSLGSVIQTGMSYCMVLRQFR